MTNIYFFQLVGVLLTGLGMIGLSASYYLYGQPLSRKEQVRLGKNSSFRRMPIRIDTVASVAFFLGGMGILTWSKFSLCTFLAYWLPNLPNAIRFILSCR